MSSFTRNLTINAKDLGQEATLLLSFEPLDKNASEQGNQPLCWKSCTFGATGSYSISCTYVNKFAFIRPQVVDGNIVSASTYIDIDVGQQTTLTVDNYDVYHFSKPSKGSEGVCKVLNDSGSSQDIFFGLDTGKSRAPTPIMGFDQVSDQSNVTVQFTPILHVYLALREQAATLKMESVTEILTWDLTQLAKSTYWDLYQDPSTGGFRLTPAETNTSNENESEVGVAPV